MPVASLLAPFPPLSSLFSSPLSSPRPSPSTSSTSFSQPTSTNLNPPRRQRILHVAPDEILLSTPNPSFSRTHSPPHQPQQPLQEDGISNDHHNVTTTSMQRLELPPPAAILPEYCLYCVPLRTGVQIITSFDLVTSVYTVGVEAQTLQQYDAPLDEFPYYASDVDDPGVRLLLLRTEQMYPRAIYVMFLVWAVIMLAKALVGFVGAWKNYYTPLRIFVAFYILSIVADVTKMLWGCLYRPRWVEPTEPIGIATEVIWVLMKIFFVYNIWFWYRTVKAHHDHNTYQSPSRASRIFRLVRRRMSMPIEEEVPRLPERRNTRSEQRSRPWWSRFGPRRRPDEGVLNSADTIANGVGASADSSAPMDAALEFR